jgi:ribosome-associated protein
MTALEKLRIAAQAALDKLAEDLVALDVREVVSFADYLLIVTGRSDRQVKAITDGIDEAVTKRGERPIGTEGYDDGRWVLMDLNDVIVHVFQREVRDQYDLERLWSDAVAVDLGLEGPETREAIS